MPANCKTVHHLLVGPNFKSARSMSRSFSVEHAA